MSVYGLPLICKQAVSGEHGTTAYVYSASKVGIHSHMPGHNGLFTPAPNRFLVLLGTRTLPGFTDAGL